ncbi:MAG: hypothetical protein ACRDCW_15205 [Sarcina sp.]
MINKKIISKLLIGVCVISFVVLGLAQVSFAQVPTKKLLSSISTEDSSKPIFKNKNFTFSIGNVEIGYESLNGISTSSDYIPSLQPNSKINVVANGTNLVLNIPFAFNSTAAQRAVINKIWISASPKISYLNNSANPKDMTNNFVGVKGNKITQVLDSQVNLNSTSSGTLLSSFSFNNLDWKELVDLNLKVNFEYAGKTYSFPVNLPTFRATNKYQISNTANVNLTNDQKFLNIQFSLQNSNGTDGFYNPLNHKVKSITFKIKADSNIIIDPVESEDLKKNSDGTYTISGALVNMTKNQTPLNKLFKIKTKPGTYTQQITVTPISVFYEGVEDTTYIASEENLGATVNVSSSSYDKSYNMGQSSVDDSAGKSQLNGIITSYSSNIGANIQGKYTVYSGSLIYNGEVFFVGGVNNYMNRIDKNSNNQYVYLNSEQAYTMKNGNPSQRASLMQQVVEGKIGKIYSTKEIVNMNDKKLSLPNLNFIFTKSEYSGKALKLGGTYTKVGTIHGKYITSNTFTLAIAKSGTTSEQIQTIAGGLNKEFDKLITDSKGENVGFFLGSANDKTPINRFLQSDIGFSDNQPYIYTVTGVSIDNDMQIFRAPYTRDINWAHKEHNFDFSYTSIGATRTEQLKAGSVITLYMGAPFILNSNISINGQVLDSKNYEIQGNSIVITTPNIIQHNYNENFYRIYNINFSATYDIFNSEKIVVWSKLGSTGLEGLEYNFNNQIQSYYDHGSTWCSNQGVTINTVATSKNYCLQTGTNVNSDGNTTITDIVYNPSISTNKYLIIGGIPIMEANVSSKLGFRNYGDLQPVLTGININTYETWLLPKANLNTKNKEILTNISSNGLQTAYKYIQSTKSGWVKYTQGMDLSNMVAYAVVTNIKGGNSVAFNYNIHLNNIQKGVYQLSNTAFKYYNIDGNVGSNSNILILTPKGSITQNTYVTSVRNIAGAGVDIPFLIGHGENKDGNQKTPKALIEQIKWANGQKISNMDKTLSSYGYNLVDIKVNGITRDLSWFENVGIAGNSGITNITFVVQHKIPFKIVINSFNEEDKKSQIDTVIESGKSYPKANIENLISRIETLDANKEGVTEITLNGISYTNNINGFISKLRELENSVVTDDSKGIDIKVTFKKIISVYQKMVTDTGKVIIPKVKVSSGYEGQSQNIDPLSVPKGYYLILVNINGVQISKVVDNDVKFSLPKKLGNKDLDIEYIVKPYITTKREVVTVKGEILSQVDQTGKENEILNTNIEIPKGYKLVKIMLNNKVISLNQVPKTLGNRNQTIIYKVEKISEKKVMVKTNIEVITIGGDKIYNISLVGEPKANLNKEVVISKEFKIVKILLDDKEVKEAPTKFGDKNQSIVYIVKKVEAKTIDSNNKDKVSGDNKNKDNVRKDSERGNEKKDKENSDNKKMKNKNDKASSNENKEENKGEKASDNNKRIKNKNNLPYTGVIQSNLNKSDIVATGGVLSLISIVGFMIVRISKRK